MISQLSKLWGNLKVSYVTLGGGKFPESPDTYQEVRTQSPNEFCLFDLDETYKDVGLSSLMGKFIGSTSFFVS